MVQILIEKTISFHFLIGILFFVLAVARYAFELMANNLFNPLMTSVHDLMTDWGSSITMFLSSFLLSHFTHSKDNLARAYIPGVLCFFLSHLSQSCAIKWEFSSIMCHFFSKTSHFHTEKSDIFSKMSDLLGWFSEQPSSILDFRPSTVTMWQQMWQQMWQKLLAKSSWATPSITSTHPKIGHQRHAF